MLQLKGNSCTTTQWHLRPAVRSFHRRSISHKYVSFARRLALPISDGHPCKKWTHLYTDSSFSALSPFFHCWSCELKNSFTLKIPAVPCNLFVCHKYTNICSETIRKKLSVSSTLQTEKNYSHMPTRHTQMPARTLIFMEQISAFVEHESVVEWYQAFPVNLVDVFLLLKCCSSVISGRLFTENALLQKPMLHWLWQPHGIAAQICYQVSRAYKPLLVFIGDSRLYAMCVNRILFCCLFRVCCSFTFFFVFFCFLYTLFLFLYLRCAHWEPECL